MGDDAEVPLARLMGRGNLVQLLRSLDLEDEWVRARQEERSDGEWGRCHGCRALSSGLCPCEEKKEEVGDNAETPLARLISRGDRVQLLRLLDLEYKWERTHQKERSDGEWGRRHGRWALSSGMCPCKEMKEEGGGMGRGGPGDKDCYDDRHS